LQDVPLRGWRNPDLPDAKGYFPPAVPNRTFAAALSSFYHPVKVVAASTLRVSPVKRSTAPVTP
jgi:hypothetical protein